MKLAKCCILFICIGIICLPKGVLQTPAFAQESLGATIPYNESKTYLSVSNTVCYNEDTVHSSVSEHSYSKQAVQYNEDIEDDFSEGFFWFIGFFLSLMVIVFALFITGHKREAYLLLSFIFKIFKAILWIIINISSQNRRYRSSSRPRYPDNDTFGGLGGGDFSGRGASSDRDSGGGSFSGNGASDDSGKGGGSFSGGGSSNDKFGSGGSSGGW